MAVTAYAISGPGTVAQRSVSTPFTVTFTGTTVGAETMTLACNDNTGIAIVPKTGVTISSANTLQNGSYITKATFSAGVTSFQFQFGSGKAASKTITVAQTGLTTGPGSVGITVTAVTGRVLIGRVGFEPSAVPFNATNELVNSSTLAAITGSSEPVFSSGNSESIRKRPYGPLIAANLPGGNPTTWNRGWHGDVRNISANWLRMGWPTNDATKPLGFQAFQSGMIGQWIRLYSPKSTAQGAPAYIIGQSVVDNYGAGVYYDQRGINIDANSVIQNSTIDGNTGSAGPTTIPLHQWVWIGYYYKRAAAGTFGDPYEAYYYKTLGGTLRQIAAIITGSAASYPNVGTSELFWSRGTSGADLGYGAIVGPVEFFATSGIGDIAGPSVDITDPTDDFSGANRIPFFISNRVGNDNNDGLSKATAWKSISKAWTESTYRGIPNTLTGWVNADGSAVPRPQTETFGYGVLAGNVYTRKGCTLNFDSSQDFTGDTNADSSFATICDGLEVFGENWLGSTTYRQGPDRTLSIPPSVCFIDYHKEILRSSFVQDGTYTNLYKIATTKSTLLLRSSVVGTESNWGQGRIDYQLIGKGVVTSVDANRGLVAVPSNATDANVLNWMNTNSTNGFIYNDGTYIWLREFASRNPNPALNTSIRYWTTTQPANATSNGSSGLIIQGALDVYFHDFYITGLNQIYMSDPTPANNLLGPQTPAWGDGDAKNISNIQTFQSMYVASYGKHAQNFASAFAFNSTFIGINTYCTDCHPSILDSSTYVFYCQGSDTSAGSLAVPTTSYGNTFYQINPNVPQIMSKIGVTTGVTDTPSLIFINALYSHTSGDPRPFPIDQSGVFGGKVQGNIVLNTQSKSTVKNTVCDSLFMQSKLDLVIDNVIFKSGKLNLLAGRYGYISNVDFTSFAINFSTVGPTYWSGRLLFECDTLDYRLVTGPSNVGYLTQKLPSIQLRNKVGGAAGNVAITKTGAANITVAGMSGGTSDAHGAYAVGSLTATTYANVANGDTFTISDGTTSITFTAHTPGVQTGNQFSIGSTLAEAFDALAALIQVRLPNIEAIADQFVIQAFGCIFISNLAQTAPLIDATLIQSDTAGDLFAAAAGSYSFKDNAYVAINNVFPSSSPATFVATADKIANVVNGAVDSSRGSLIYTTTAAVLTGHFPLPTATFTNMIKGRTLVIAGLVDASGAASSYRATPGAYEQLSGGAGFYNVMWIQRLLEGTDDEDALPYLIGTVV